MIEVDLEPGMYVVAVSGGVDSLVLLDVLRHKPGLTLVVAHFDHGVREDSSADRLFVAELAESHGLPFVYEEGKLGANISEATARQARYEFLHRVRVAHGAQAIITAHHQDDVLETAIINLIRGTNRRGLSSLQSTDFTKRPLLHVPKSVLLDYARTHDLDWHEDSTNSDEKYLRNYVRWRLMSRVSDNDRQRFLATIKQAHAQNKEIDKLLAEELSQHLDSDGLERSWFISLPHNVAREVMTTWLRQNSAAQDRRGLERLVVAAKTYRTGQQADVDGQLILKINRGRLALDKT